MQPSTIKIKTFVDKMDGKKLLHEKFSPSPLTSRGAALSEYGTEIKYMIPG